MLHIGKYIGYIAHGGARILGYIPKLNKYLKNKTTDSILSTKPAKYYPLL